jgi:hypothetical protein
MTSGYIYTVTCEAYWRATSQFTNEPALHEPVEKVGIGHLLIGVDVITERRPTRAPSKVLPMNFQEWSKQNQTQV